MGVREQGDLPIRILDDYYPAGVGRRSVAWLYFSGNVADTETITIGGRVFEFDTNGTYTAGRVPVDVSASVVPAAATVAFAAAVNGDDHVVCSALVVTGDVVILYADSDGSTAITLAEATANVVVSAATFAAGAAAAESHLVRGSYTLTAADAATMAAGGAIAISTAQFASGAPTMAGLVVRDSSYRIRSAGLTDAQVVVRWVQIGTGTTYYLRLADGAAVLAATNMIDFVAIG